ncbi:MAG: hypothetical protein CME38_06230 [Haliea sp.]|nr:hypothetical protein [Haliea sp.]|tara:strand:- start:1507 stop:2088 length:582 start_codon:yes stop_codon:yes gene_type:complete
MGRGGPGVNTWRRLTVLWCLVCLLSVGGAMVRAESPAQVDTMEQRVARVLDRVARGSPGLARLIDSARAVLVFPEVVPMTFGEGGQYGEGALLVAGSVVAHYASTGTEYPALPAGVPHRTDVLLFMTDEALWDFRNRPVWRLGLDGRVSVLEHRRPAPWSAAGDQSPVLGFSLAGPALREPLGLANNTLSRIR